MPQAHRGCSTPLASPENSTLHLGFARSSCALQQTSCPVAWCRVAMLSLLGRCFVFAAEKTLWLACSDGALSGKREGLWHGCSVHVMGEADRACCTKRLLPAGLIAVIAEALQPHCFTH